MDSRQKYTGGMYIRKRFRPRLKPRHWRTSHGIPRIFNRPEVVFVTLRGHVAGTYVALAANGAG
jgi:hypothetical protein